MIIYSAFADAGLAVRAAIAGAEGVLPKAASPRALLDALRGELRPTLDPRALRALGERLDAAGPARSSACSPTASAEREIAATLGLEPECARARRWAMLARLGGAARRHRSPPPEPPCDNTAHAHERPDPRGAEGRHRPRAAPQTSSSSGWSATIDISEQGAVNVTVSLTTPGCPIKGHFQTGVDQRGRSPSKASPPSASASTSSPTRRSRASSRRSAAPPGCPRARSRRSRTSSASAPARAASASPR